MTWIFTVWRWLTETRPGRWVAIAAAGVVSILAYGAHRESEGEDGAEERMQEHDRQNADDIRRRARDADGHGMHDDERGYRD